MLSAAEIVQHQALLGEAYYRLTEISDLVESGLTLVAASDDVGVSLDLVQPFALNYDGVDTGRTANLLRDAALALQGHIERRSGQSMNDYLYSQGIKVTQNFADLCQHLGVTISVVNIE
jgi:hypothetical protein